MAAPKLNDEHKEALLQWLAAGYSPSLILQWFSERDWPSISTATVKDYLARYEIDIKEARKKRRAAAIDAGVANKEERIKRLAEHADVLEKIKWTVDNTGKCPNEKAWRETLNQIRQEIEGDKVTFTGRLDVERTDLTKLDDTELAVMAALVEKASTDDKPTG
jgi:hypothetical protein